jgi:CubicO group peptidase (beta-lactamase class C family)
LFNMSFTVGLATCDDHDFAFAAGLDDRFERTPLLPDSLVPSGSVTKPWTAVAILQMLGNAMPDGETLNLSTPANKVIDPLLRRTWGTSMQELWLGSAQMNAITIRDLLGHTSGIQEYPGSLQTLVLSGKEFGPKELIDMTDKELLCPTVPCPKWYSSINYVLLGLAITHLKGLPNWAAWDQRTVIPEGRRRLYNATAFPKLGACTKYGRIAHQYAQQVVPSAKTPGDIYYMNFDISDLSCLNGWAMGNIAASGHDLAMFFRDLYAPPTPSHRLISESLAAEMVDPSQLLPLTNPWACPAKPKLPNYDCNAPPPGQCASYMQQRFHGGRDCCRCFDPPEEADLTTGWPGCTPACIAAFSDPAAPQDACIGIVTCPGVCEVPPGQSSDMCPTKYGLGMFLMDQYEKLAIPGTGDPQDAMYYGHGGVDYGSGSAGICGYNYKHQFGFCVNYNSYSGLNCSLDPRYLAKDAVGLISPTFVSCKLYSEVLQSFGGPTINCMSLTGGYDPSFDCARPPATCADAIRSGNANISACCGCPDKKDPCDGNCDTLDRQYPECAPMLFCPEFCPPTELEDGAAANTQSRRIHPVAIGAVATDLTAIMESTPNTTLEGGSGQLGSGGPTCSATMQLTCGSENKGDACNICCGQHQIVLRGSGCSPGDVKDFCAAPVKPLDHPVCIFYNNSGNPPGSGDPDFLCHLCDSTVFAPCKPCQHSKDPACALCAGAVQACANSWAAGC